MAFLERRRLNFFDQRNNVDDGKISEAIGNARVTSSSSGYGALVLGDSSGRIHLVNKAFEVRSFQAYNQCVTLLAQCKQLPYLTTIGEDGIGINPHLRIWHTEKVDKNDAPLCLRISRVSIPNKVVIPTALCISDNMTIMAIGFNEGSILVFRGDLKKERSSKQTLIKEEMSSITGLALSAFGKTVTLYITTVHSIEMYDISHKDREKRQLALESEDGCSLRCSVLVEEEKDKHFFVARSKAVYCYTNGVLGPCYAVDGNKLQLQWFRGYLIIVSEEVHPVNILGSLPQTFRNDAQKGSHVITVLDTRNNVTAFHSNVQDVQDVLIEWGSFYVLTSTNQLSVVQEKDLHSKLSLLFKRNLFDVAIRVAKFHQYDSDGLMEMFRQYGDHLYSKGDHKGAIEQYIKTIGKLEPSYVIRKYLGSQQVENLTTYLQELHKQKVASGEHTTLLLNFYTKLNKPELLKEFIMTKDREIDFDVEVAIDVCRHVSPDDALLLAEKHGKHDWYLSIQIEDLNKHSAALEYIGRLSFDDADNLIRKYGSTLLEHIPEQTTQFLIRLCTDYRPSDQLLVDESSMNGYREHDPQKASPEGFIHYFLDNSERLVQFLEKLSQSGAICNPQVYTTLLEHYLQVWLSSRDPSKKASIESKIMKLLESSDMVCDKLQALVLCKTANFRAGLLYLYEHHKMYQFILKYHIQENDFTSLLGCCRRYEHREPGLWVNALCELKSHSQLKEEVLSEILEAIERGNLMSPVLVIDTLSKSPSFQTGHLKSYLRRVLQREIDSKKEQDERIALHSQEILDLQNNVTELVGKPIKFQASRCSICKKHLELPAIHFFCQHSFHQHCIQSYAENDECPLCLEMNKQLIDTIKSQEENKDLHEMFHSDLEQAEDGFSIVTNYLGRGVFTNLTNYGEVAMKAEMLRTKLDLMSNLTNPTHYASQAASVASKSVATPKEPTSSVSYSSCRELDERAEKFERIGFAASENQPSRTAEVRPAGRNPFGELEEERPSANPFGNPFDEEEAAASDASDDYDKNLNPFA